MEMEKVRKKIKIGLEIMINQIRYIKNGKNGMYEQNERIVIEMENNKFVKR